MDPVTLLLTIVGIIIALVFGYLQVIVPFTKGEVKFSKKFPFVVSTTEITLTAIDTKAYAKVIEEKFPTPAERKPIAVLPFKNLTDEASYDYLTEAIPNLLITNLGQSKYLSVMTWERMHDILEIMGRGDVEIIDDKLGFELCRMDNVDALALGSFTKAGDMFATDIKVLDVTTKKILKTTSSKGKGIDSILENQIDELSRDIYRGVGLSEQKTEETKLRIADVTTSSMDAYHYFLRGRENFEKFYHEDALRFLKKAVELDSTFAMAHFWLAYTYHHLMNYNERYKNIKKAKKFSHKVTDRERLHIEAFYARWIETNSEKYFRALKKITNKYPKEKREHRYLGWYYYERGLINEAIEEFNKALELDPNYGFAMNSLGYAYAKIENFEKALEYLKRYASVSPGDANPFDSMGEVYFRMGQLDEAIAKYKEALEVKPDFDSDWRMAYIYALKEDYPEAMKWVDQFIAKTSVQEAKAQAYVWKGFYHYWLGSLDQSFSDLAMATELAEKAGSKFLKSFNDFVKGWIYYDRKELELSRRHFNHWFDLFLQGSQSDKSYDTASFEFYFGLLDLMEGRIDSTKSRLAEMKSLLPKIVGNDHKNRIRYFYDLLHAEVLLAQDSIEKAIAVCEKASKPAQPSIHIFPMLSYNMPFGSDVLARAYQQKGELDKAIAEYGRLTIFNPNSQDRRLIRPTYHYKLATLYEEKGSNVKAIEQYEKFLDIWKNADADRPEKIDARERLVRLKAG